MFYLPPQEPWYHAVAKLAVTFDDNRRGAGTGFFILDEDQYFLVTARHVVDPKCLPGHKKRDATCAKFELSFVSTVNPGSDHVGISYQRFLVAKPDFAFDKDDVDVAVLKIPRDVLPIREEREVRRPLSFHFDFLATEQDFAARYAGEPVVFVGYPENSPVNRVGESEFCYPLLRQGVLAYPPIHGIEVQGELGRNYGLIDSFAQSGFSGGPIVLSFSSMIMPFNGCMPID